MFFVPMEDGDKMQNKAWSLVFFISAWLEVKTFAWLGILYVLLTNLGFKKMEKVVGGFFDKIYTRVRNYEVP